MPDEGDVHVDGKNTRDIRTDTEWLSSLDRFGIVTERAVLLEGLPLAASMALPFTLAIDPMPDEVRATVSRRSRSKSVWPRSGSGSGGGLSPEERVQVHLARALGVGPALLLLEHPTARLDSAAAEAIGRVVQRVAAGRGMAWLALTEDEQFVRGAGGTRAAAQARDGRPGRRGILAPAAGVWSLRAATSCRRFRCALEALPGRISP